MLDSFFGSLSEDGDWQRLVFDRGFVRARDRLAWIARDGSRCLSLDASGALLFDAQALGEP